MSKGLLGFLNSIISLVVVLTLLTAGLYSAYALWDNRQIYNAAQDVQSALLAFKPKATAAEGEGDVAAGPSFEELLAINPDVCGWITLDGTAIDHAVLQGADNLTYINRDAYGNFALAGSIFLDSRCDRGFGDPYSLLYGHHMVNHGMFGDLDLYKDAEFYRLNHTGTLMTPGAEHPLHILACVVTLASDDAVFEPATWEEDSTKLLDYAWENALYVCEEFMAEAEALRDAWLAGDGEMPRILALSTCSSEYTNARTILLTLMDATGEIPEDGVTITLVNELQEEAAYEDAAEPAQPGVEAMP